MAPPKDYESDFYTKDEPRLRHKLAVMCRMLGHQGLIGMFGHVSIRVPGTDRVLITPGAGSEKTAVRDEDIFVYDVSGTILEHPGGDDPLEIPAEWRIHTQIHRDRPNAMCIAHLHAHYSTVLGIGGREVVPVFMHGAVLHSGVPTWDNPRLVVNDDMAASLSQELGDHIAVQMRGHGSVIVADCAEIAFFICTFMEENSRRQLEAEVLGGAIPLSAEEMADCARGALNPRLFSLLWQYYERRADAISAGGSIQSAFGGQPL